MTRVYGRDAIALARSRGLQLYKHADAVDGARSITPAEARELVAVDPSLVYVETH